MLKMERLWNIQSGGMDGKYDRTSPNCKITCFIRENSATFISNWKPVIDFLLKKNLVIYKFGDQKRKGKLMEIRNQWYNLREDKI